MKKNKFEIWIDFREHDLPAIYKGQSHVKIKHLEVGDIQIVCNEQPTIIIERKKAKDFAASIYDGRYRTQKAKMKRWLVENAEKLKDNPSGMTVPVCGYLIEGLWWKNVDYTLHVCRTKGGYEQKVTVEHVLSAATKTLFRDDFFLLFSQNVPDTETLLDKIYENFAKGEFRPKQEHEYHEELLNAKMKSQRIRKRVNNQNAINAKYNPWWLSSLANIQYISVKKAKAICCQYPSVESLLNAYAKCKTEKDRKLLIRHTVKIPVEDESKNSRFGMKTSETIYRSICGEQIPKKVEVKRPTKLRKQNRSKNKNKRETDPYEEAKATSMFIDDSSDE